MNGKVLTRELEPCGCVQYYYYTVFCSQSMDLKLVFRSNGKDVLISCSVFLCTFRVCAKSASLCASASSPLSVLPVLCNACNVVRGRRFRCVWKKIARFALRQTILDAMSACATSYV